MEDLEIAVKDLGNNKSRDALGQINEEEVAGTDIKLATLKMMNLIKDSLF